MRRLVGPLAGVALVLAVPVPSAQGGAPAVRFRVTPDLKAYPQATAKEALASALEAVKKKRIDYLLAQLTDPEWVDGRVSAYEGGFDELVKETTAKLDPPAVKRLGRFLADGEIETLDATAVVRLKEVKERVVRLRRLEGRWYLQSVNKP